MQRIQIGLQIGQADGRVGADLIEIVHDGGLGDHRQLTERSAVQAAVEVPVERGALGRERPQRRNLPPLVRLQLRPAPPLVTAQAAPQPQHPRDHRHVHRALLIWRRTRLARPARAPRYLRCGRDRRWMPHPSPSPFTIRNAPGEGAAARPDGPNVLTHPETPAGSVDDKGTATDHAVGP